MTTNNAYTNFFCPLTLSNSNGISISCRRYVFFTCKERSKAKFCNFHLLLSCNLKFNNRFVCIASL
uniref:Uncharacterized protein n=1 Tax=Medicago truncatula TaxID=3880 RepID=I3STF6_MEDTR|nr:unknown [Medicago truncatula]